MAELICPKCHGEMHNYERSGVVVDQCEKCSGIFLDHGELERLTQAEDVHYGRGGHGGSGYGGGYQGGHQGGFLGGLFGGGHHERRGGHH